MAHNKLWDLYWSVLYSLNKKDAMFLNWGLPDLDLTIFGYSTFIEHTTWDPHCVGSYCCDRTLATKVRLCLAHRGVVC